MPTKYPKGSYIVREGRRRKVLAELEDLRFISYRDDEHEQWEKCVEGLATTVFELERSGWKEEKQNLPDTANFTVHCTACKKEIVAMLEGMKKTTHYTVDNESLVKAGNCIQPHVSVDIPPAYNQALTDAIEAIRGRG